MTHRPAASDRPDVLSHLAERLEALEGRDVVEHPAVLTEVHRAMVAELDALGGSAEDPRSRDEPDPGSG